MAGQGRPRTSINRRTSRRWALVGPCLACAAWLFGGGVDATAAEVEFRLRLAWGDGLATRWRGQIHLSEGELTAPVPLGIEADESGTMWLADGALQIQGRSARRYEGVDITLKAPEEARLYFTLGTFEGPEPEPQSIRIADLRTDTVTLTLDERNNRLVARRAPGDSLRLELDRDHLVAAPAETLSLRVTPHELGLPADTRVEVTCQLRPARADDVLWEYDQDWIAPSAGTAGESLIFEPELPQAEGAYDIVITARRRSLQRLGLKQTVAERRVQVMVIDSAASRPPVATEGPTQLEEIDPSGPRWWERLTTVPLIPGIRKGPLGSGDLRSVRLPSGAFVELAANASPRDISWEAYLVPIKHPGQPHVLEIEFPANVPQQLGISIVEPNAAGAVAPVGVDSGLYVTEDAADSVPATERHRLVFWPRGKTPLVLMTNQSGAQAAVYGKLRLSEYAGRLPARPADSGMTATRRIAAYYDRPLWAEQFGAAEALDAASGRSLKDWRTFHDGGTRLLDYLKHSGRNALIAPAWSDGCALYPSELIESTPRYDNGTFFGTAQDPVRKDVLEMLFRLCDREGIQFTPMLDFSAPLIRLEQLKRDDADSGIEWTNARGETWSQVEGGWRGQAPYYNALHPTVRQEMLEVVRELTSRYAHHPSFAGVAVQLSAHGYAQSPGPEWGMDQATLAEFARETGSRVDADRPEAAAALLLGKQREAWLTWRARRFGELHRSMREIVSAAKPGAHVMLTSAHLLERGAWRQEMLPRLPRNLSVEQLWLRAGIAPERYGDETWPLLPRPTRYAPADALSDAAADLELYQAVDIDRRLERCAVPAAQFYHEPRTMRVHDFERQSPFKSTYCWLISQPTPIGAENRRRFAHAVASLDPAILVDGGWTLPVGNEEALRDVFDAYRALPAARFQTIPGKTQPVVARMLHAADGTYLYLVNDSPWPASAEMTLSVPPDVSWEGLAPLRQLPPLRGAGSQRTWTWELAPYDLIAVRIRAAHVSVANLSVSIAKQATEELARRVNDVWTRAKILRNTAPMPSFSNADFEASAGDEDGIPGWTVIGGEAAASLTGERPHAGRKSVVLESTGEPTALLGPTFDAPPLGRLQVSVWTRAGDLPTGRIPLQVVLEGEAHGEPFERRSALAEVSRTWTEQRLDFLDLPLESGSRLRVRFELLGPGQVCLDDVSVSAPGFNATEMAELAKILQLASDRLQAGQLRDCQALMEGYWPRFIESCTPSSPPPNLNLAERPPRPQSAPAAPPPKPGFLERINRLMPSFVR